MTQYDYPYPVRKEPPPLPPSSYPDGAQPGVLPRRPCEKPIHTRGNDVRPCRTCAKAICTTCVIKAIPPKFDETVYQSRRRLLCKPCWDASMSPTEREASLYLRRVMSGQKTVDLPFFVPAEASPWKPNPVRDHVLEQFCRCACKINHGMVCLACKTQQLSEARLHVELRCTSAACSVPVTLENYGGSRCQRCNLPCGPATRIEGREIVCLYRMSAIKRTIAMGYADELIGLEPTFDSHDWRRNLAARYWRQDSCQMRFERASDEAIVEMLFGVYVEEEWRARDRARSRLREEMIDPRRREQAFDSTLWYGQEHWTILPADMQWLNRKGELVPLIGECDAPKSLTFLQPRNGDDLPKSVGERGKMTGLLGECEQGDENTLCDSDSDGGTLKDGTGVGGRKTTDDEDEAGSNEDDDARTITSMGSTLIGGMEMS